MLPRELPLQRGRQNQTARRASTLAPSKMRPTRDSPRRSFRRVDPPAWLSPNWLCRRQRFFYWKKVWSWKIPLVENNHPEAVQTSGWLFSRLCNPVQINADNLTDGFGVDRCSSAVSWVKIRIHDSQ